MPSSNKCPSALRHLFFVNRQETMNHNFGRQLKPCGHEHRWPKEEVKINNVFSDKVNNLRVFIVPIILNLFMGYFAIMRSRSNVSNWRVKPDIVKFIFFTRNFESKVRTISANAPILQFTKPIADRVHNLGLQIRCLKKML